MLFFGGDTTLYLKKDSLRTFKVYSLRAMKVGPAQSDTAGVRFDHGRTVEFNRSTAYGVNWHHSTAVESLKDKPIFVFVTNFLWFDRSRMEPIDTIGNKMVEFGKGWNSNCGFKSSLSFKLK